MTDHPLAWTPYDADRAAQAAKLWLIPKAGAQEVIAKLAPAAVSLAKMGRFTGELGQVMAVPGGALVGLGAGDDPFALGAAASTLAPGDYVVANPMAGQAAQWAALGWVMGAYHFDRYQKSRPAPTLVLDDDVDGDLLDRESTAIALVRDLVNTPAEDMGPSALAAAARDLADQHGAQVEVISGAELAAGFPLVHAVGRAAQEEPRLIDLRWGPEEAEMLTLVGKGVCFDSGGLNIKGGTGMRLMKKDMGGAANVLGLAHLIMAAGLKLRLRVLIPAVENAIAGNAFRPGDVFTARDGTTVEISNTDAEGRLVLADALAYAAEERPARIISLATLTGAARVALGPDLPPIYSTDPAFGQAVSEAGHGVGDPVWPMPLWQRYNKYLASDIADVNHAATSGFAGSITAALFLERFVPKAVPYTHLDIFAWVPSARPGRPKGGEATGIRALFETIATP